MYPRPGDDIREIDSKIACDIDLSPVELNGTLL